VAESILLINTMRIERGKLEDFKVSVKNSLAFVQENGPQLLVEVYVDEENLRARWSDWTSLGGPTTPCWRA
jgi:hypothetical protein